CSISVLRLHLLAPLFPYTTLFRSLGREDRDANPRPVGIARQPGGPRLRAEHLRAVQEGNRGAVRDHPGDGTDRFREDDDAQDDPDRKSTRLNSSHVKISYAVFSLK